MAVRARCPGPFLRFAALLAPGMLLPSPPSFGQEKKDAPLITAIAPIRVAPGAQATLKLRGVKLDAATEVQCPSHPGLKAELKEKKKADLPGGVEAKDFGDTQAEATLTLPADFPEGPLSIVVATPDGISEPREIIVSNDSSAIEEKEPNNGFDEAQSVELGKWVRGRVKEERDVDVFVVQLDGAQTLAIEVVAARRSSLLDPLISVFDEKRRLLRVVDDAATRDPAFAFAAPAAGKYCVVLQDAGDRGGAWHNYELSIRAEK